MKQTIIAMSLVLMLCGCAEGNDPVVGHDPATGAPIRRHTFTVSEQVIKSTFDLDPPMGPLADSYGNCLAAREGHLASSMTAPVPLGGDCSTYRTRAFDERRQALTKIGVPVGQVDARATADLRQLEDFMNRPRN